MALRLNIKCHFNIVPNGSDFISLVHNKKNEQNVSCLIGNILQRLKLFNKFYSWTIDWKLLI